MKSSLLIISFIVYALVLYLKSLHHTQGHLNFLSKLSSRSFIVLHFAFRIVIHLKLIFVKDICPCLVFPALSRKS